MTLPLEKQVASLEPSKKLRELGVKQESYFVWQEGYHSSEGFDNGKSLGKVGVFEGKYYVQARPSNFTTANVKWNEADLRRLHETSYAAFTTAELGEMLPEGYGYFLRIRDTNVGLRRMDLAMCELNGSSTVKKYLHSCVADTEADARAKMLIYLLENNLIEI